MMDMCNHYLTSCCTTHSVLTCYKIYYTLCAALLHLFFAILDDGWSGTRFDRPGFLRMRQDIESKRINLVLVKDLSRLGRNNSKTEEFITDILPAYNCRLIAVNDGVDTLYAADDVSISTHSVLTCYKIYYTLCAALLHLFFAIYNVFFIYFFQIPLARKDTGNPVADWAATTARRRSLSPIFSPPTTAV